MAELKYGMISVDDHVQEHPEVWTKRMSQARWGDQMPQVDSSPMARNAGWWMARK